jgi:hypothetical protein
LVDFGDFLEELFLVFSDKSQHVPQVSVDGLLEKVVEDTNVPGVELD